MKKLPEYSEIDEKALRDLSIDFENIVEKNQKINENNTYKQLFSQLDLGLLQSKLKKPESYHDLISRQGMVKGYVEEWKSKEKKYKKLEGSCPTCEQPVDEQLIEDLIDDAKQMAEDHQIEVTELEDEINNRKTEESQYEKYAETKREFEDLHSRINNDLPTDTLDGGDLSNRISELKKKITDAKSQIQKIAEENEETTKRNTRIQVILEQTGDLKTNLKQLRASYLKSKRNQGI